MVKIPRAIRIKAIFFKEGDLEEGVDEWSQGRRGLSDKENSSQQSKNKKEGKKPPLLVVLQKIDEFLKKGGAGHGKK